MGDIERPSILSEEERAKIRRMVQEELPALTSDQLDALCDTLAAIRLNPPGGRP